MRAEWGINGGRAVFKQHIEGVWSAKDWLHATRENYKEAKKKRGTGRKRTLRQAFELVSFSASGACHFLTLFASHILMLSYSYGASAILKLPSNRVCCGRKWCKFNFNVLRVHGMCRCWQKVNLPVNFHAWVIMLICWNIWMRLVLNDEGECCAEAVQPVVESGEKFPECLSERFLCPHPLVLFTDRCISTATPCGGVGIFLWLSPPT